MSLVAYTITALEQNVSDADASGKNVAVGAACSMFIQPENTVVQMFDDSAGANGSTAKNTGANGQVIVYINPGVYRVSVNGSDSFVTISNDEVGVFESLFVSGGENILFHKDVSSVLDIGAQFATNGTTAFTANGLTPLTLNRNVSNGTILVFMRDGTAVGNISLTTGAVSYNATSDERVKGNILPSDSALPSIIAMQVKKFDWLANDEHEDFGLIAQELVAIKPSAVFAPDDENEMMGVDMSKLVPLLIKGLQESLVKIETLEGKVNALENAV